MSRKSKIVFVLILSLILISLIYNKFSENELESEIVELVEKDFLNKEVSGIEQLLAKYEDKKDYYQLKELNKIVMLFFKGVNDKKTYVNIFPEYKEFFNLADDYFIKKYGELENVFYEILSIRSRYQKKIVKLRYKEEGKDTFFTSEFIIDGNYIVDEAFIDIDDVASTITKDEYLINLKGRAIYDNKSVYKIEVINLIDGIVEIDYGMYGFYAKDMLNKHYHRLVMDSSPYIILPFSSGVYFVEIPSIEVESLFINITKEELKLL